MTPCRNCQATGIVSTGTTCPVCGGRKGFKPVTLYVHGAHGKVALSLTAAALTNFTKITTTKPDKFGHFRTEYDLTSALEHFLAVLSPEPYILFEGDDAVELSYHTILSSHSTRPESFDELLNRHFGNNPVIPDVITRSLDDDGFVIGIHWTLLPLPSFSDLINAITALTTSRSTSFRIARWEGNYATGESGYSVLLTNAAGDTILEELSCHLTPTAALATALKRLSL